MEFQYEQKTVFKHILCWFFFVEIFLAAFQMHPVERRSEGYFLTPGKRISKQVSTLGILILYWKHKLLRHLNPSQTCNGFRLYFGVSGRFNMIPFN